MAIAGSSPDRKPRRFLLKRDIDASGVSGTGYVAEGVQFSDGHVAVRWRSQNASVAVFDSIGAVEAVHGHNGNTKVVWLDVGFSSDPDTGMHQDPTCDKGSVATEFLAWLDKQAVIDGLAGTLTEEIRRAFGAKRSK